MLAAAPEVGYIDEVFNIGHRPGICAAEFDRMFTHVSERNEAPYREAIAKSLRFEYSPASELAALRTPKDAARMVRDWFLFERARRRELRPLLKDPVAFFSAEWLAERFGMEVVVLVRHPAAFVGSLRRLDWRYPFEHFLEQQDLMEGLLAPLADEIEAHVGHEQGDMIEHASLLWKIFYSVALTYQERHPDWLFVRHEDLSRDPLGAFRTLYDQLGIRWSDEAQKVIRAYSGRENPEEVGDEVIHQIRRDSRANIWKWKERLTPAEIEQIRERVEPVSRHFYGESDW